MALAGALAAQSAMPERLRAHVLQLRAGEPYAVHELRPRAVLEIERDRLLTQPGSAPEFEVIVGRVPRRFDLAIRRRDPEGQPSELVLEVEQRRRRESFPLHRPLPLLIVWHEPRWSFSEWRHTKLIWIPAPQDQRDPPELKTAEEYSRLFAAALLRDGTGSKRPDRLEPGSAELSPVAATVLTLYPIGRHLSPETRWHLLERLPPSPSLWDLVKTYWDGEAIPFLALRRIQVESARLLMGDLEVLDAWELRGLAGERGMLRARSPISALASGSRPGDPVPHTVRRTLSILAQTTDDAQVRGRALWPLLDPAGPRPRYDLYRRTSAQIERGEVILPGTPEQRRERRALMESLLRETDPVPSLIAVAGGAVALCLFALFARRAARRRLH